MDEWKVYQSRPDYWYTKVMCNTHHVHTFVTFTRRGGERKAIRLVRKRKGDFPVTIYRA